jgi:hypothetical protein
MSQNGAVISWLHAARQAVHQARTEGLKQLPFRRSASEPCVIE